MINKPNHYLLQKNLNWIQSAGINNKKYNPWVGAQLLGVRDQFLIFHPLILLWDLKRIQLFLNRVQSYTNYSVLLVDSRPTIQTAIENYLSLNNIPKSKCHVLHFDFPGTLTNQYYMSTQSKASSLLSSRQIIVFFDYFLNKQFYTESLIVPSIRLSLYSLQNLPTNMQYGLPSKTGLLLAIRLLLKLLLKPLSNSHIQPEQYTNLISNFQKNLPHITIKSSLHTTTRGAFISSSSTLKFEPSSNINQIASWKITAETKRIKSQFDLVKKVIRQRLQTRQECSGRKYYKFFKKKVEPKVASISNSKLLTYVRKRTLAQFFSLNTNQFTKSLLNVTLANQFFITRKQKYSFRLKKLKILKITKSKFTKKIAKTKINKKPKKFKPINKLKKKTIGIFSQKRKNSKLTLISNLNLISILANRFTMKQSKKRLIAKYERTCNIKTQKEWQEIKQKNKLKLDKKKMLQREKQIKARRQKLSTYSKGNRPFVSKKTKGKYHRQNLKLPFIQKPSGFSGFLSFKTNRRSFSSFTQSIKPKNNVPVANWTEFTFGKMWRRRVRKGFRQILPTQRVSLMYRRYFSYPCAKRATKVRGAYLNTKTRNIFQLTRRETYFLFKKLTLRAYICKTPRRLFKRMLYSNISGMRRWTKKIKSKRRILKFRQWRRVMKRISRKRDRRWRQRKWKRAAMKQLRKAYQCVYTKTSLWSGFTYWTRWHISKSRRSYNWRKWRSRYFRRYTRKEQVRLQLLYRAHVAFFKRARKYKGGSKGYRLATVQKTNIYPKVISSAGVLKDLRLLQRSNLQDRQDGRLNRRFTKKRFLRRRKLWKRILRKLPRFRAHRRRLPAKRKILSSQLHQLQSRLVLSTWQELRSSVSAQKKNYLTQLWFRLYRNIKLVPSAQQKVISKNLRQVVGQKKNYLGRNQLLQSYWTSTLTLKHILAYKHTSIWNWRLFKNRPRTVEEFKRYVQNFQHTAIKLHKHKVLSIITSKKLRQLKIQKLLHKYNSNNVSLSKELLPLFVTKPVKLSKIAFLKFNGKFIQNKNILLGFNTRQSEIHNFIQCYSERRFWANDNFGPSPLIFWISPKARRKKTPKQLTLKTSVLNFRLDLQLPNFSCLADNLRANSSSKASFLHNNWNSFVRVKELNHTNSFKKTFKFVVGARERTSEKRDRWLWYFLKNQYPSRSILWQQGLNYQKKTRAILRVHKVRKVLYTHYQKPKSLSNYIAYLLRCNRRRRRRLRERTFKGPTRYRRKYRTQYMFNNLIRLNSHRARYGKPDTRNHVNHYFIRKLVLRRFLRLIYGPKLTNKYFKHFSNLLFVKKFKFWTLYTFFYLRLDFVAILLKFAMNLTWSRQLIQQGLVLVNGKAEKASYSIFLGDVVQLQRLYACNSGTTIGQPLDWIRNLAAFAPRVASSLKYQTRLRIPAFFEYSARIKAGTMFRLPWYYEVRGKLVNKENFLLLARGHHSI